MESRHLHKRGGAKKADLISPDGPAMVTVTSVTNKGGGSINRLPKADRAKEKCF